MAIWNAKYIPFVLLLLTGVFAAFLGAFLYRLWNQKKLQKKLKRRFEKARGGELSAEKLLKKEGYELLNSQKSSQLSMWVNGKHFSYLVRPDAFAQKEGKTYLVEIKTGQEATNPKKIATRRQLLEYFHGFDVDGVLLVNAELEQLHDIYFESRTQKSQEEAPRPILGRKKLIVAFMMGVLCMLSIFLIIYWTQIYGSSV